MLYIVVDINKLTELLRHPLFLPVVRPIYQLVEKVKLPICCHKSSKLHIFVEDRYEYLKDKDLSRILSIVS